MAKKKNKGKQKGQPRKDSGQQTQATVSALSPAAPASSSFGIKCNVDLSGSEVLSKPLSLRNISPQLKQIKSVADLATSESLRWNRSLPIQDLDVPLAHLINLCEQFAASDTGRERILREYPKIFPGKTIKEVVIEYLGNTLTLFAFSCTQQNGHTLLIAKFVDYRQRLALICEEPLFVTLAARIDAELANSYAAIGDYPHMLETFERMEPNDIKNFLRGGRIGDLCLYLISELDNWLVNPTTSIDSIHASDESAIAAAFGPPQLKESMPAPLYLARQLSATTLEQDMSQLSTILANFDFQEQERALTVKQQYKSHEIIALVEKYGELALAALRGADEEVLYLPFMIAYSIFRAVASDKNVATDIMREKFYYGLKVFPSEEQMRLIDIENSDQIKGKLYFQKALMIHLYCNFLRYHFPQEERLINLLDKNFREALILAAELQFLPAKMLACDFVEGDPRMRVYQQQAAEEGRVSALYNEAYDLITDGGLQTPGGAEKVFDYLEKASQKGYAKATFTLGQIYFGKFQPSVVKIDYERALEYYKMAAEQGKSSALLEIGRIHLFYSEKQDFSYVLGLWQQVKQESPDTIEVYTLLAISYLYRITSLDNLRNTSKIPPDIIAKWNRIIISYAIQGLLHCKTGLEKLDRAAKRIHMTPLEEADLTVKQMEFFTLICYFITHIDASIQRGHSVFLGKLIGELFQQIDFVSLSKYLPLAHQFEEAINDIMDKDFSFKADIEQTQTTKIAKFYKNLKSDPIYSSLDTLITRKYEEKALLLEAQKEEIKISWLTLDDFLAIDEELFTVTKDFVRDHTTISFVFDVYNNFGDQELSNVILTLYETSCLIWQTGSNHRDVFASHRDQFNSLLENLMMGLGSLSHSEEELIGNLLSYLPKALIALGRLRLSVDEPILNQILMVLIELIIKHNQQFLLEDNITLLYAFTLLPIAEMTPAGNQFLLIVLQNIQSNELSKQDVTFSQLSQLYYSLVVIDAIQMSHQQKDYQLASKCGQIAEKFHKVLMPFLSQICPYSQLHQLMLAIDYYRFVKPNLFRKFVESEGFSKKYRYVFSRVEKGHISKLQCDILKPLKSVFSNVTLHMELFYGLLPGDVSVLSVSYENAENRSLLFEPGGPTHYLCNDITQQESKQVCPHSREERARLPRDIFHDQYKIYWFAEHGAQETVEELFRIVNSVLKMANKPLSSSSASSSSSNSHRVPRLQVFPISFTILDKGERIVQEHIHDLLQLAPLHLSASSLYFFNNPSELPKDTVINISSSNLSSSSSSPGSIEKRFNI